MIKLREDAYEHYRDDALKERRPLREHLAYVLERQLLRDERREPDRQPAEALR